MKKLISILLIAALAVSAVYLSGCNNKEDIKETEPTTAAAAKDGKKSGSEELKEYLNSFVKGGSPLYGTWQIEGIEYISFIFRNDKLGEMVMGNEGDFASLSIKEDTKTLGVSFILGLNGIYDYELSDDNKTLTLNLDGKTVKMFKQKDYNLIPKAPKNPKIDEKILGWWKSEENLIYFFGDDGIMYSNHISLETCYTYNAEKGKIDAVYNYGGDVKTEIEYKIKDGKLTIDGQTFEKFTP